ncbi:hypothetical protein NUSPORA_00857 [Nucleospora cyclopteri]
MRQESIKKDIYLDTNYKKLKIAGRNLFYNNKHVIFNNKHIHLEVENMVVGDDYIFYIEKKTGIIYYTEDFEYKSILGYGKIIGIIQNTLFYIGNSKLSVFDLKTIQEFNIRINKEKIVFEEIKNNKVTFRDSKKQIIRHRKKQDCSKTAENRLEISPSLKTLIIYKNQLLIVHSNKIFITTFNKGRLANQNVINMPEEIENIEKIKEKIKFVRIQTNKFVHHLFLNFIVNKERILQNLSELDIKIIKKLSTADQIKFIRKLNKNEQPEVKRETFFNVVESCKSLEFFYKKYAEGKIEHYKEHFKELKEILSGDFFYCKETKFLDRKFSRRFFYDPENSSKKHLVYKVIYALKFKLKTFKKKKQKTALISESDPVSKLIKNYPLVLSPIDQQEATAFSIKYKNKEQKILWKEIKSVLIEKDIKIPTDLNDNDMIRSKMFIMRAFCNLGNLILKNMEIPSVFTVNGQEISIPEGIQFLNGISSKAAKQQKNSSAIFELGNKFVQSMHNNLKDEEIHEIIKALDDPTTTNINYLLLILSTREKYNAVINSILINYLQNIPNKKKAFDIKCAAAVALGIHNLNANDKNIKNELFLELENSYKNILETSDMRNFRILLSISLFLINTKENYDCFVSDCVLAELFIKGNKMRFGECHENPRIFSRNSNQNMTNQQLFYSFLFEKMENVSSIDGFLDISHLKNALETTKISSEQNRRYFLEMSSFCFFLSFDFLFSIKCNRQFDVSLCNRNLLQIIEICEEFLENTKLDQNVLNLFNYSLISISIINLATNNVEILRILRRQILKTKNIKNTKFFEVFSDNDLRKCYNYGYNSCSFYKICIALVISDKQWDITDISLTIKILIVTFFYREEQLAEFNYIDVFKVLLSKILIPKEIQRNVLTHDIKKVYRKLMDADKKYFIDVLSDFYENFTDEREDEIVEFLACELSKLK